MTRVLVTGANGHTGSNVMRILLERDIDAVPLVREGADLRGLEPLDVEPVFGDILDEESITKAADGCDVIINHAAAYRTRARDPDEIMKPAIVGVEKVLRAAARLNVRRVIHTSSVAAVGLCHSPDCTRDESDWNEEAKLPYYVAKTESEKRARALAEELSVDLITLCPTFVLGQYDYRITPSTRYIMQLADRTAMTGNGGFNVVDVRDVARAHVDAIDKAAPGERYIIGGDNITMKEMGATIGETTGKAAMHIAAPRAITIASVALMALLERMMGKEPAATVGETREVAGRYPFVDNSKAREKLGLEFLGATEVLRETLRWLVFRRALNEELVAKLAPELPPDPAWS